MARRATRTKTAELAAAFSELGPAWGRWITACTPTASVSYSRMRLLRILEQLGDRTMTQLATSMNVAQRRITSLVAALVDDGMVERRANPDDGRSSVISLTQQGREHVQLTWKQFQADIAQGFADLTDEQQRQLLEITPILVESLRRRTNDRTTAT
jgi:DNA-binding MarR family transcriptional regulator